MDDGDLGIHSLLNGQPVFIEKARQLLFEQPESTLDFRCIECGEAVRPRRSTDSLYYFQHLKWNRKCEFSEKLSRLQELAFQFPLVTGLLQRELNDLPELTKHVIVTGRKRGRRVDHDILELIDPLVLDATYPLVTISIRPLGRAKYPYAITNVGETRLIGSTSEKGLVNRLRASVSNFNKSHKEVFKVVIDCDKVYLHRKPDSVNRHGR